MKGRASKFQNETIVGTCLKVQFQKCPVASTSLRLPSHGGCTTPDIAYLSPPWFPGASSARISGLWLAAQPHTAVAVRYVLDINFAGRKVRLVKRNRHTTTLREELEDWNDYVVLTGARVRDEGKPRITHAEVDNHHAWK